MRHAHVPYIEARSDMSVVFETRRLQVRHLEDADLPDFYAVCSNPELMRYMGDGVPLTEEQTARWIQKSQENYRHHGYGCMAVIDKADGKFIGFCGIVYAPGSSDAEIIYALDKPYWGKGLAREVAGAMLEFGLNERHLDKILATIHPDNKASVKVVESIGMVFQYEKADEDGTPVLYFLRANEGAGEADQNT